MIRTHRMRPSCARHKGIWLRLSAALFSIGAIISSLFVVANNTALGSNASDTDTLGFGELQSKRSEHQAQALPSEFIVEGQEDSDQGEAFDSAELSEEGDLQEFGQAGVQASTRTSMASLLALKQAQKERVINVPQPDPVVEITAFDASSEATTYAASQVGVYKPPVKVPRILPNTQESGWHKGLASAYDLETNQGWSATASGIPLTRDSVTVAVPVSQKNLIGRAVEIVYGDKVVVATITDTGGFARYGRALDLAGGVWKAFGARSWAEWGVRPVYYRVL